jgi:hypothetical protein
VVFSQSRAFHVDVVEVVVYSSLLLFYSHPPLSVQLSRPRPMQPFRKMFGESRCVVPGLARRWIA